MALSKLEWALVVLILGVIAVFGYLWWQRQPGQQPSEASPSPGPADLVAMVGTVKSADASGITIVVGSFVNAPSGRYYDEQEHRFSFVPATGIYAVAPAQTASPSPAVGEAYLSPFVTAEYGDIPAGSPVTVMYSASDTQPVQTAWQVLFPQP